MENCWLLTDGLIEQSLYQCFTATKVTLPISFSNTNWCYSVSGTHTLDTSTYDEERTYNIHSKTVNSFYPWTSRGRQSRDNGWTDTSKNISALFWVTNNLWYSTLYMA